MNGIVILPNDNVCSLLYKNMDTKMDTYHKMKLKCFRKMIFKM